MVADESFLAVARLLRELVGELGEGGTFLGEKEVAEAVQGGVGRGVGVVYGPRGGKGVGDQGRYRLGVGRDVVVRSMWGGRRHPDGVYL